MPGDIFGHHSGRQGWGCRTEARAAAEPLTCTGRPSRRRVACSRKVRKERLCLRWCRQTLPRRCVSGVVHEAGVFLCVAPTCRGETLRSNVSRSAQKDSQLVHWTCRCLQHGFLFHSLTEPIQPKQMAEVPRKRPMFTPCPEGPSVGCQQIFKS